MALINRISRLFRADMHAVLDRLEEPDALLKQALREMEESINQQQLRLKQLQQRQAQYSERQRDIEQSLAQIQQELAICFDSNNEMLARTLIRRRLEAQRFSRLLARKQDSLDKTVNDINQSLAEQHTRLADIRQKQEVLCQHSPVTETDEFAFPDNLTVSEEDVEIALLREKQQRALS